MMTGTIDNGYCIDHGLGMLLNMMYRVSYTAPRYDTVLYYLDTPKLCL
jgi:hypothetical protein